MLAILSASWLCLHLRGKLHQRTSGLILRKNGRFGHLSSSTLAVFPCFGGNAQDGKVWNWLFNHLVVCQRYCPAYGVFQLSGILKPTWATKAAGFLPAPQPFPTWPSIGGFIYFWRWRFLPGQKDFQKNGFIFPSSLWDPFVLYHTATRGAMCGHHRRSF